MEIFFVINQWRCCCCSYRWRKKILKIYKIIKWDSGHHQTDVYFYISVNNVVNFLLFFSNTKLSPPSSHTFPLNKKKFVKEERKTQNNNNTLTKIDCKVRKQVFVLYSNVCWKRFFFYFLLFNKKKTGRFTAKSLVIRKLDWILSWYGYMRKKSKCKIKIWFHTSKGSELIFFFSFV